jgi:hypothetical protein
MLAPVVLVAAEDVVGEGLEAEVAAVVTAAWEALPASEI